MVEDCLILIAKMQEKQPTPMKNVQRVKAELRKVDPSVKVMTHSGLDTQGNKEGLISRKGVSCNEIIPLETRAQPQIEEGVEPFLKACLKLLRNPQAVGNLLALLNTCAAWPTLIPNTKDVHKLYS